MTLKILNICDVDTAGDGIRLTEAINKTTSHKARHLCKVLHPFGYPHDIWTRKPEVVEKWVSWADIVNVHSKFHMLRIGKEKLRPKNLIITYHGRHYRRKPKWCHAEAKKWGAKRQLCTTMDLTKWGATWMPVAIPVERYQRLRQQHWIQEKERPIVCQVPSDPRRKGTAEIIELLGGREDMSLLIKYGCHHDQAMRRIARCDIYVDEFRWGLGTAGLEACAMGVPVIAWAAPEDEECILREVGYLPYYKSTLDELPGAIDELLGKPEVYREYADRAWQYIIRFHDYPVIARWYVDVCEKVMAGGV